MVLFPPTTSSGIPAFFLPHLQDPVGNNIIKEVLHIIVVIGVSSHRMMRIKRTRFKSAFSCQEKLYWWSSLSTQLTDWSWKRCLFVVKNKRRMPFNFWLFSLYFETDCLFRVFHAEVTSKSSLRELTLQCNVHFYSVASLRWKILGCNVIWFNSMKGNLVLRSQEEQVQERKVISRPERTSKF